LKQFQDFDDPIARIRHLFDDWDRSLRDKRAVLRNKSELADGKEVAAVLQMLQREMEGRLEDLAQLQQDLSVPPYAESHDPSKQLPFGRDGSPDRGTASIGPEN